ncbi:uncharacterized mitochondrial protein AtMg00810-like [Lathyrus oleraceus]|uniref:uncharacterized mitochondrial protein AtMg00810-like n=1 Tax=Pisum sativum TaxID=3888 RepID=UPI0021D01D32|nr:uncharacterized mitochondrial protein AtMg00810-like [Pisum sativum]
MSVVPVPEVIHVPEVIADSPLMPPPSLDPVLQPESDLPITLRKDDIVITGSNQQGILQLKQHLLNQFQTKDLDKLRYFLGIEVAQSKDGLVISHRKYAMDILEEIGLLNAKPADTPMDPSVKLLPYQGEPLSNLGRYRSLVGNLNYLTVTRPNISFVVSMGHLLIDDPPMGIVYLLEETLYPGKIRNKT